MRDKCENRVFGPHEGRCILMDANDVNAKRRKKTLKVTVRHKSHRFQSKNTNFEKKISRFQCLIVGVIQFWRHSRRYVKS
ncbi:hypothetical protein CEXT_74051 [Caerostris extrusa]|uniref:Uncharacterized protein n=1 Tax=Caerostris extrusa TaxID=172846 RepID=A0AAV4VIF4_CAEEX|nr:hypothetical protein CEXT_74051 [Caerostris extrusa]